MLGLSSRATTHNDLENALMTTMRSLNLALILLLAAVAACIASAEATPLSKAEPDGSAVSDAPLPAEAMDPGPVLLKCICDDSGICPAGEIANQDIACVNTPTCPGQCHFNYCKDANGRKTRDVDVPPRDCTPQT